MTCVTKEFRNVSDIWYSNFRDGKYHTANIVVASGAGETTEKVDLTKFEVRVTLTPKVFEPTFWQNISSPDSISTATTADDHSYYANRPSNYRQVTVVPKS